MRIFFIYLTLFLTTHFFGQDKDFVLDKTVVMHSTELNEERTLNIYLREGYNASESYPVIYLPDGSANEDFIHIAGLVQFC